MELPRGSYPPYCYSWDYPSSSIKLHSETQVSGCLGMSGGRSPRHAQNPLSGERRKTLSITHHALSPPPSQHHLYIISSHQLTAKFLSYYNVTQKTFVPKSDVKQWFTTTTTIYNIVASELKDPICHSDECQIGSFSSEATIYTNKYILDRVGRDGPFEPVEEFICYLYMAPDVKGDVDKARADICSYMLCVRIINPSYGCTLISSVFNHLLVHLSHLMDGYLWALDWQLHGQHCLQFQRYVLN